MSEKTRGDDGLSWPWTMDAAVWAAEFKRLFPESDEGLMLSWFANAIMCGYDTARQRRLADVAYADEWRTTPDGTSERRIGIARDGMWFASVLHRYSGSEREVARARTYAALGARLRAIREKGGR